MTEQSLNIILTMESNPYTSPSANLFGSASGTTTEGVPQEAITHLQRTKPWVRLIGVFLWIGVVLMLLSGVAIGVASVLGLGAAAEGGAGAQQAMMMIAMGVVYGVMSLLYIYPAVKIWKYGTFIGKLVQSRSSEDLVAALDQQRAFWKFVGILFLISIVIYFVVIVGVIAFGAMFAGASGGMGDLLKQP